MQRKVFSSHGSGFTLVELVVTLAVVSILVSMAAPSFSTFVKNARMVSQTNDIVAALNTARSEAVTRGIPVSICPSDDGLDCTGVAWDQGWIVFTDEDTPGTVDGTDEVIKIHDALQDGFTLALNNGNFVRFQPVGDVAALEPMPTAADPMFMIDALADQLTQGFAHTLWRLLPGTEAHAAPGGGNGGGGNGGGGNDGGGNGGGGNDGGGGNNQASCVHAKVFTLCDADNDCNAVVLSSIGRVTAHTDGTCL